MPSGKRNNNRREVLGNHDSNSTQDDVEGKMKPPATKKGKHTASKLSGPNIGEMPALKNHNHIMTKQKGNNHKMILVNIVSTKAKQPNHSDASSSLTSPDLHPVHLSHELNGEASSKQGEVLQPVSMVLEKGKSPNKENSPEEEL